MRAHTRLATRLGLCLVALSVGCSAIATSGAAGAQSHPSTRRPIGKFLKAKIEFTKDRYAPGDRAHIVVTLSNSSSTTVRHIGAACDRVGDPDELANTGKSWGPLRIGGPGVRVRAHDTRTVEVSGKVPVRAQQAGQVVVACDFGYANGNIDKGYRPEAEDTARVPGQSGALAGDIYYYPHGHSGAMVGLQHVRAVLVDAARCPVLTRTDTTDAKGHFRLTHAPAGGFYKLYLYPPKGWKVRGSDPTNAMVFGKDTSRYGFEVRKGSKHVRRVPTKCS